MTILSTIMGVESGGGHNLMQGNIGDINNQRAATGGSYQLAQGYYQITGPTWAQFGGLTTGYTSPIQAPYATQVQVAQNIPVSRWGPDAQSALRANGYQPQPGETLGQMMQRYGEDPAATRAADGSGMTGGAPITQGPTTNTQNVPTSDPNSNQAYTPMGDSTGLGPMNVDLAGTTMTAQAEVAAATAASVATPGPVGFMEGTSAAIGGWLSSAETTLTGVASGVTSSIEGMAGKITTSIETSVGDWANKSLSHAMNLAKNWAARWGFLVLAIILLLIAVWRLTETKTKDVIEVASKLAPMAA